MVRQLKQGSSVAFGRGDTRKQLRMWDRGTRLGTPVLETSGFGRSPTPPIRFAQGS